VIAGVRMPKHMLAAAFTATIAAAAATAARAQSVAQPRFGAWGVDLTAMDRSVTPGDDFNRYASGAWFARTPIPPDRAIVSLRTVMSDTIEGRLHSLMERSAHRAGPNPTTLEAKVGAFYHAFMETNRIDSLGASPIEPELAAIRGAANRAALAALMGRTETDFEGSIFGIAIDVDLKNVKRYAVSVGQAGLGLPDRDYYLTPAFAAQRAAYHGYVARLLTLIGWPNADTEATAVVAFETRIAQSSWTKTQQRDPVTTYNPTTRAQLGALTPGFPWHAFLENAGLGAVRRVIVSERSALPRIAAVYDATPLHVLKAWAAFTVADNAAFYLSGPFSTARFQFRDSVLSGQTAEHARWKRAIQAVSGGDCGATGSRLDCHGNMGFGVGQLYTAVYFPPASKADIEALVANVKAAMRERLERLDWMSATTKSEALKKLDTYQIKVGYPDHARDFSGLVIGPDDLVGDVRRAAAWDWQFYVRRLTAPVDRSDWTMTPQTNDAYNGELRDIVFPAGILQPPEFDPAADPAVNYGAIGFTIGHELTHGFDDKGREADATGALRNWWTPADEAAFTSLAARLGAQYSSYEPVPGVHVNGALTMGENIADLGGVNVALDAYHRSLAGAKAPVLDGFTGDQRFFLAYAQLWRGYARDDYVRKQVVSDPHAPRGFRVIGPLRNVDIWYTAFNVRPDERYFLPPDQRVRIW
jgi:putative endopeptidase